jgi:hypothetical protein
VSEDAAETFIVRLGDGPGLVLMKMEVSNSRRSIVVQATLRPDLLQTAVSGLTARSLGLSRGQGVMLQLARRTANGVFPWGPVERVTPAIDEERDPSAEGATAGLELGRDFLHAVWLSYVNGELAMISWPAVQES